MINSVAPTDPRLLRQLAHDLRSELFVITMGLEQLKLVRQDEQQFLEVWQLLTKESVEKLKSLINGLADEAQRCTAGMPLSSQTDGDC